VNKKLLFGFVVVILSVGVILASCAPASTTPTTPTTPTTEEAIYIPFGTCSCLSGPYAPWGLSEHWAQEIEVEDINSGGGCWGDIYGHEAGFRVNGQLYKWNLIAYDYKMDPDESVKVINRLVYEDNVKFMHVFVWVALYPNRETLEDNKIFVSEQGMGEDIIGPEFPRTFRFLQQPNTNAAALVPYLHDELGYNTVCIIGDDTADGRVYSTQYGNWMRQVGMQILSEQIYEPNTQDYTPYLNKAIADNPDLIAGLKVDAPLMGMFVKQARELGYKGDIFMGAPFTWKELVETCGSMENIEGLMSTMMIGEEAPLPRQQWLRDAYIEKHGEAEWDGSIVDRADPIYMITLAIEKANSLDPDEVAAALESMESPELKSFYGDPCWFGGASVWGTNHDLVTPAHLIRVTNGHPVTLATLTPPRDVY
jgi:branched-chain amino acid transport system substrate-binding protein